MEQLQINKYNINEEGETVHEQREYNIKNDKDDYILRLEINDNGICFILLFKDKKDYIYKKNWSFLSLSNELKLNQNEYSKAKPFLDLFDRINEKKNFSIRKDNDENYILIIKYINAEKEENYEIKFNKNHMSSKDKFNIIFNQIELLKENYNKIEKDTIEKINIKINDLNNKIDKKDEEIRDIINKKDGEIKDIINKKDGEIKDIINKKDGEIKDIINKKDGEIKNIINKKDEEIKSIINKKDIIINEMNLK